MSATTLQQALQPLVGNLSLLNLSKYADVASATVLALEIISTTEEEITYIWPTRWTLIKFIYFINRYSPIIDTALSTSVSIRTSHPESCSLRYEALGYIYTTGTFFSEFILVGRTLALYDFRPAICIGMASVMIILIVLAYFFLHAWFGGLIYADPVIIEFIGCIPSQETRPGWVLYACILISETVVVVLTLFKRWQTYTQYTQRSVMVQIMYRDGTYYYIVMFILTLANMCIMVAAPEAARYSMQVPLRVIHSTLCTRVLLNLRMAGSQKHPSANVTDWPLSELVFDNPSSPQTFEATTSKSVSSLGIPVTKHIEVEMETITSDV